MQAWHPPRYATFAEFRVGMVGQALILNIDPWSFSSDGYLTSKSSAVLRLSHCRLTIIQG